MDRPTRGSSHPNDREPVAEEGDNSAHYEAWTGALSALQAMARKREQQEAAPEVAPGWHLDVPAPIDPVAAPPTIDETLDALQALARRYNSAAQPGAPVVGGSADPNPDRDDPGDDAPPDDIGDPGPSARPLHRKRPGWASLALILASAAVLAVLLVGALSLSRQLLQGRDARVDRPPAAGEDLVPANPSTAAAVVAPTSGGAPDLRAIEEAMADCDNEAAKNRDSLYFVIVPAISPTRDYQPWTPLSVGDIGTSVILLRSKDVLDGLRNGSLALFGGAYRFAIIDSNTEVVQDWPAVTGVAKLVKTDAAGISGFRVRFSFSEVVGDTPSNFSFPRDKGVCYWVSALLRS
jgi:hypothetical protein